MSTMGPAGDAASASPVEVRDCIYPDADHLHVDQDGVLDTELPVVAHDDTAVENAVDNRSKRKHAVSSAKQPTSLWLVAAGAAVSAAGLLLWRKTQNRSGSSSLNAFNKKIAKKKLVAEVLNLKTPSVPLPSTDNLPLKNSSFVVSDKINVQNVRTACGSSSWQETQQRCAVSALLVDTLVQKGAKGTAVVPTQALCSTIPDSDQSVQHPLGRNNWNGRGEYGPAIAVATHLSDLAVAVDELGSALIPAACCGVYAYRPTSGVLPLEGAGAASSTLATTCLLAQDPEMLVRAGKALGVPGSPSTSSGVAQYLVAEDIFGLCDADVQRSAPAVVAAVRRWAGSDQAQAVSLCQWLFHKIPTLAAFMPPENNNSDDGAATGDGDANGNASIAPAALTERVLAGLAAAASAVKLYEWKNSLHGAWTAANFESVSSGSAAAVQQAQAVTEERYSAGIKVAENLSTAMRAALQEGYVFVLPTVPGPAPRLGGGADGAQKLARYAERCTQLAALASLGGVPQVAIPMPSPTPGGLPLSISCVTLQRRDLLLLKTAAKLGPMLSEAVANLDAPSKAARSETAKTSHSKSSAVSASAAAAVAAAAATDAAEAQKLEGNAAFKAGRYPDAVRRYSEAIQLNPNVAVYYSNRAMASLKLGMYSSAEADCDAALELDPKLVKALLRRGSARLAQGKVGEARGDFKSVLDVEPRNKQAIAELEMLGEDEEDLCLWGNMLPQA